MSIESADLKSIGTNFKTVVLTETRPLSDVFSPIMLTDAQYKTLTALLYSFGLPCPEHPETHVHMPINDDVEVVMPDARQTYTPKEIKDLMGDDC